MQYFTGELDSAQFYERMATSFIDNVKIKILLNIENNIFKIHKNAQDLKKMQISTLIGTDNLMKLLRIIVLRTPLQAMKTIFLEIPTNSFSPSKSCFAALLEMKSRRLPYSRDVKLMTLMLLFSRFVRV